MFLKLYRFCLSQYHRYRDIISYLFWGVMTTVVNYAAYFVCTLWLHINYLISNVIAWVVAVIFAFVVNKVFVFRSLDWSSRGLAVHGGAGVLGCAGNGRPQGICGLAAFQ